MPAPEQTRYNMRRMHRIFAVSSVLLTLVTIWMLARDHQRQWKRIQRTSDRIEMKLARWQKLQTLGEDVTSERERLEQALAEAMAQPPLPEQLQAFRQAVLADAQRRQVPPPSLERLTAAAVELQRAASSAATARQQWQAVRLATDKTRLEAEDAWGRSRQSAADEAESLKQKARALESAKGQAEAELKQAEDDKRAAEAAVVPVRKRLLAALNAVIDDARFREDEQTRTRKRELAKLDVAKARLGLAERDARPDTELKRQQDAINALQERVSQLTLAINSATEHRQQLESIRDDWTRPVEVIQTRLDENQATAKRLDKLLAEKESSYFEFWGIVPLPGKKWLELPFLDAFNSPRKIDNIWNEGLDRAAGSFARVPRFDRCTTCHQGMQKALPDRPSQPALRQSTVFDFALSLPAPATSDTNESSTDQRVGPTDRLRRYFGLQLAAAGLLGEDDVTVQYVDPKGLAQRARPWGDVGGSMRAGDIRRQMLWTATGDTPDRTVRAGLLVGDVIVAIDDQPVPGDGSARQWVIDRLLAIVDENSEGSRQDGDPPPPIHLRVRRGLPDPYAGHPRLDLFVGSTSPHRMSAFGCTVCHEGQGGATEFKWASHTPNDVATRQQWRADYGWFANRNWPVPMLPRRFVESSCLKCHHDVVELQRSPRDDDPPAPKVAHGFRLIKTYGCFGCHEMLGFDDRGRRIGPDLRLEPNYYAAALQLKGAEGTGYDRMNATEKAALDRLIEHPDDEDAREHIYNMLSDDARLAARQSTDSMLAAAEAGTSDRVETGGDAPRFSDTVHQTLLPLLKNQTHPGTLRKVGPSLRHVRYKLDDILMSDWIRQPSHFRPSTRMPQSFGLRKHLPAQQLRRRRDELQQLLEQAGDDSRSSVLSDVAQIKADLAAVESELADVDEMERRFEPIAIYSIVQYLQARSQLYRYVEPPAGITPTDTEEGKQAQIVRGKVAFQERGCLACHNHVDFPDIDKYRDAEDVVHGPDLSDVATKFSTDRNPNGRKWLYSWIAQPSRYSVRTTMPNLMLAPVQQRDAAGNVTAVTDPVADIVAYLMNVPARQWQPSGELVTQLSASHQKVLDELALTYLQDVFPQATARKYLREGIPNRLQRQVRGAERELLNSPAAPAAAGAEPMTRKRLFYVARKSMTNSGCFACHDIPGLEAAKPIGPALSDWGRKDTRQLAFGHVAQYLNRTEGELAPPAAGSSQLVREDQTDQEQAAHNGGASGGQTTADGGTTGGSAVASREPAGASASPPFYRQQLEAQTRIGFIFQKLKEPRSFDYLEARNKKYTERLRMPQFSFSNADREAIITFVLGLVADPPAPRYVYTPAAQTRALLQGQEVMTKYSCRSCHMVNAESWDLAFPPDYYGPQTSQTTYPFVTHSFTDAELALSLGIDRQGRRHARIQGLPAISQDGLPLIYDDEEFPIEEEEDESFELDRLIYALSLRQPAAIDGEPYQVGEVSFDVPAEHVVRRQAAFGGTLAKYLLPRVVQREKEVNPNAKGSEAWAWLPPSLVDEGAKVQPEWLYNYLLQPHLIRPATVMRMPRYNMSDAEVTQLVDYFAAQDVAQYPYHFESVRQADHLAAADRQYAEQLRKLAAEGDVQLEGSARNRHLQDAMKIVTSTNYCIKCHIVGDFQPVGIERVKAPDLAAVHQRLRADYVRKWLAKPTSVQPYTSMPVNIPYDPTAPLTGTTVPQELYHGSSIEQLDALVDLLMNFDQYNSDRSPIAPIVKQNGDDNNADTLSP